MESEQTIGEYIDSDGFYNIQEKYDYFTIYKLKRDGADFEIDELGYGDFLISSLVKVSKFFNYSSFDNVVIFSKSRFNLGEFLKHIIKSFKKISFDELLKYLLNEYGISTTVNKIRNFLRGSDVYIDRAGILYGSYKTYIESL